MMLQTLPAQDGYHMPAEFAPQSGVLLVWPVRPGSWGIDPRAAQEAFCAVMRAASRSERVYLLADAAHIEEARAQAGEYATVLEVETNDAWARVATLRLAASTAWLTRVKGSYGATSGCHDSASAAHNRASAAGGGARDTSLRRSASARPSERNT